MTLPIKELRAKAEAATPGPWRTCSASEGSCRCRVVWQDLSKPDSESGFALSTGLPDGTAPLADWHYIAAASPDVVLSLLDECDRLAALHDELLKSRSEGTRIAFEQADAAKVENARLRALLDEACDLAHRAVTFSGSGEYARINQIREELK